MSAAKVPKRERSTKDTKREAERIIIYLYVPFVSFVLRRWEEREGATEVDAPIAGDG